MTKKAIKRALPNLGRFVRPELENPKPKPTVVNHWTFPIGDKLASLRIEGCSELSSWDMDALQQACEMFRRAIQRREGSTPEDFCI